MSKVELGVRTSKSGTALGSMGEWVVIQEGMIRGVLCDKG